MRLDLHQGWFAANLRNSYQWRQGADFQRSARQTVSTSEERGQKVLVSRPVRAFPEGLAPFSKFVEDFVYGAKRLVAVDRQARARLFSIRFIQFK